jgi:hypothetical protein
MRKNLPLKEADSTNYHRPDTIKQYSFNPVRSNPIAYVIARPPQRPRQSHRYHAIASLIYSEMTEEQVEHVSADMCEFVRK